MKKLFYIVLLLPFMACKQAAKTDTASNKEMAKETVEMSKSEATYPEDFNKILEAHGGIANWRAQRTLSFVVPKPDNPETHTVDLWNRNEIIATKKNTVGFDGKPWVLDTDGTYKGNPEFYHNLMFYFYAMPFVLGDEGINYSKAEDLVYDGVTYPGIEISYNAGVGASPKDNYYLYYNPETYQMEWLGYTVTYRSGEKSDRVSYIRYNDWKPIDGIMLPNSLSWYKVEDGKIGELRNKVVFEDVSLSKTAKPSSFYAKPEAATYWVKPAKK